MSSIRYGNFTAEIVSGRGVRITRLTLRQADLSMVRSARPGALPDPRILGREQQAADALSTIGQGRPIGFHAACGYGKTTLLQHIAAVAARRYDPSDCVYLRADRDRVGDLLQDLVTRLYDGHPRVKLTREQCAQLLGQVRAVVLVDDLSAGPEQVDYLLGVLSGCSVVIGSDRPIGGLEGGSHRLAGLSADDALALLSRELGRPLTGQERPAARDLADAVDGQPLHLKQAAALLQEGRGLAVTPSSSTDCKAPDNGDVVSEDPPAGTSVSAGAPVTIGVCAASTPPVLVPNVIGQSQSQATSTLQGQGLEVTPLSTGGCNPPDNGNVVFEDPPAGTSVSAGASVSIGVCAATTPPVLVPNVIGQGQDQATKTLQAQGLTVSTTNIYNGCDPGQYGAVVSENPAAGTSVAAGSRVTIVICLIVI